MYVIKEKTETWEDQGYLANIKTTLYTMIKVCIFNKSDDVSRFDIFEKVL